MFNRITPQSCDKEIFKNGSTVFCIGDWDTNEIENWVQEVATRSGQKVDWHYAGGRANILGLGDIEKIRQTIKEMLPELNKSINEYAKNKWKISSYANFTEADIDTWRTYQVYRKK
jgi:hypothetical protein